MRLWILSDLHLSAAVARTGTLFDDAVPDADVAIVAGDICEGVDNAITWLARTVTRRMPTIYVIGNHEFYGEEYMPARYRARAYAERVPGLHLLDDGVVEIGGTLFIGGTLWTDYRLFAHGERALQQEAMRTIKSRLSDHSQIWMKPEAPGFVARHFEPRDALEDHILTAAFIEDQMTAPYDGPIVVVTHHAPHPLSIAPRWQDDALTPAFVSDLSSLIDLRQPTLWVHGHTHASFDYTIDHPEGTKTRVICNPHGYGPGENPAFRWDLVVEV